MLTQIPCELNNRIENTPSELRSALIELIAVSCGVKPVMRITSRTSRVSIILDWLGQNNFKTLLRRQDIDAFTFAQIAPNYRRLNDDVLWQIFIARSENSIKKIADALQTRNTYEAIGYALGYPSCCVSWATKTDLLTNDGKITRQTNLIAASMKNSKSFAAECNCLLRDCTFTELPTSAISHYPCRFDCTESIALARTYINCFEKEISNSSIYLNELLRKDQIWWSDVNWSVEFANEFPGMILDKNSSKSIENVNFKALSVNCETPGGNIPREGALTYIGNNHLLMISLGRLQHIDLTKSGSPSLLQWL